MGLQQTGSTVSIILHLFVDTQNFFMFKIICSEISMLLVGNINHPKVAYIQCILGYRGPQSALRYIEKKPAPALFQTQKQKVFHFVISVCWSIGTESCAI